MAAGSTVVTIPKSIRIDAGIRAGDHVLMETFGAGRIVLTKEPTATIVQADDDRPVGWEDRP